MINFIFDLQRFDFSGNGSGNAESPYEITTAAQLAEISSNLSSHFKLMNDIELSGEWTPIGNNDNRFNGTFDGGGYTISNLTINGGNYRGLFGYTNGATIRNVNLTGVNVTGKSFVGSLVGYANNTTISNCHAQGSVTATDNVARVGGLVGFNTNGSTVEECSFSGDVKDTAANAYGGGLVGYNNGTIKNSAFLDGSFKCANEGAIAGKNKGTLTDNYYYGTLADGVLDNGATELKRKFTVPSGVTCTGDGLIQFGNTYGTTSADSVEVTFTYDGNDYKYTVSEDINVTIKDSKLYVNDKLLGGGDDSGDSGSDSGGDESDVSEVKFNKTDETKSTSATLQSDFAGTLDARDYRNLTTIKVATGFNNDIEIIGNRKANTISSGAGDDSITGGYGKDSINGGAGDDTLTGGTSRDTLTGGKGADTFIYNSGDGKDVITDYSPEDNVQLNANVKRQSVNGKDVVIKVQGGGELTLKKAVGKAVTVVDANGNENINIYRAEGLFDEDDGKVEIWSTFAGTFKASDYKNLEVINAGGVRNALNIVGNDKGDTITGGIKGDSITGGKGGDSLSGGKGSDTLRGGAGDDTLTGGTGRNIFVYESGDDMITDFSIGSNRIQLLNGSVTTDYQISGEDLTLNFDSGSLTIENYDGKAIKFLDASGKENSFVFTDDALYDGRQTSATLKAGNSFTADDKLKNIDATQLTGTLDIIGNGKSNSILGNDFGGTFDGGAGNDSIVGDEGSETIIGGRGNDKLWGNGGGDTFIHDAGDGHDYIYGFTADDMLEINGVDEILPVYNSQNNSVKVKCGSGSITLEDFSATSLTINNDTWTLADNKLTKN